MLIRLPSNLPGRGRPSWLPFVLLYVLGLFISPSRSSAQVGDTTGVTYPGWTSSDKVRPAISVAVSYDSASLVWRYEYVISNSAGAQQQIADVTLRFSGQPLSSLAPAGWDAFAFDTAAAVPSAVFMTVSDLFLSVGSDTIAAPTAFQIAAGDSKAGFSVTSRYPPGQTRSYARGYAGIPYLSDTVDYIVIAPNDTTDSQRGWTLGPTRYTAIITQGTQETTDLARANRFLSFMNVDTLGTTLTAPAPIAVKFDDGSAGDYVIRSSFRAFLNNVEVTGFFHPGPQDGASLVAVFTLGGGSPLIVGENTLKTAVSGLPSTFSASKIPSAVDTDTIIFTVQP